MTHIIQLIPKKKKSSMCYYTGEFIVSLYETKLQLVYLTHFSYNNTDQFILNASVNLYIFQYLFLKNKFENITQYPNFLHQSQISIHSERIS